MASSRSALNKITCLLRSALNARLDSDMFLSVSGVTQPYLSPPISASEVDDASTTRIEVGSCLEHRRRCLMDTKHCNKALNDYRQYCRDKKADCTLEEWWVVIPTCHAYRRSKLSYVIAISAVVYAAVNCIIVTCYDLVRVNERRLINCRSPRPASYLGSFHAQ